MAGVDPAKPIVPEPGYQVPFAEHVRRVSGVTTAAVGTIVSLAQAEAFVAAGKADAVSLARVMLYDPRWPYHVVYKLGPELA